MQLLVPKKNKRSIPYIKEVEDLSKKESQEEYQAFEKNIEEKHNKDDQIIPILEEREANLVEEIHDEDRVSERFLEETIDQYLVDNALCPMFEEENTLEDEYGKDKKNES